MSIETMGTIQWIGLMLVAYIITRLLEWLFPTLLRIPLSWFIVGAITLSMADLWTTSVLIQTLGIEGEGNILLRVLYRYFGLSTMALFKIAATFGMVAFMALPRYRDLGRVRLWFIVALSLVTISNTIGVILVSLAV